MPRYFFHIVDDDGRSSDEEGLEFPDLEAATREGEKSARQLLNEAVKTNQEVDNRRVEVADYSGHVLKVCRLKDLLN